MSAMTEELKSLILEGCFRLPLGFELERAVAMTDDLALSIWVASEPLIHTSTIAAHLEHDLPGVVRQMLRTNPEAPLDEMRAVPAWQHSVRSLTRFAERSTFAVPEDLLEALTTQFAHEDRPLGELWDELYEEFRCSIAA